jgi:hypothetical protein
MPAAIAQPAITAFALGRSKRFIHLRLHELLHGHLHDASSEVIVLANDCFEFTHGLSILLSGHGCFLVWVA